MRPSVWPVSMRSPFTRIFCEHPFAEAAQAPRELGAGGADGPHGASWLPCEAVLAAEEDVSNSICYQPGKRQRELSPATAWEGRGGMQRAAGSPPAPTFCHPSPAPRLLAPTLKEITLILP